MRLSTLTITLLVLLSTGCTSFRNVEDSVTTLKDDVIGGGEYEGKRFKLNYMNSAVFEKTLAMYILRNTGEIDVAISKGMTINNMPKRLDDIFVAAVDNGADFYLTDKEDEVKERGIGAIMAIVTLYSNYSKLRDTYRKYIDDRAKVKLGNYIINVYYDVDTGEISHVKFTHREFGGVVQSSKS